MKNMFLMSFCPYVSSLRIVILSAALLIATTGRAQVEADTLVSYVVCDAGSDVYELEGHAALRVRMPEGPDMAVHYGLFDFNAPAFVWRFALGQTDYLCGATPWEYFLDAYAREGRRVTEHRLNLTSGEKSRLVDFLAENLRPENRVYRYNYVKDNCATRPLRAVEVALADSILLPDPTGTPETFRSMMRAYHRNYPWYQFGIDLALGSGIDYTLSPREKSFAPITLGIQLPDAATAGGRRLVAESIVAAPGTDGGVAHGPTPWWATPLAFALAVLACSVGVTVRDLHRRRVTRWFDALLFGMLGLAGCLVFFLVFFSTHEATSPNFLLAWVNPLCLIPVIFIWIKKAQRLVMCYQIANFAALLVLCLAWPLLPQSANAAFWPLIAADAIRAANYITLHRTVRL